MQALKDTILLVIVFYIGFLAQLIFIIPFGSTSFRQIVPFTVPFIVGLESIPIVIGIVLLFNLKPLIQLLAGIIHFHLCLPFFVQWSLPRWFGSLGIGDLASIFLSTTFSYFCAFLLVLALSRQKVNVADE